MAISAPQPSPRPGSVTRVTRVNAQSYDQFREKLQRKISQASSGSHSSSPSDVPKTKPRPGSAARVSSDDQVGERLKKKLSKSSSVTRVNAETCDQYKERLSRKLSQASNGSRTSSLTNAFAKKGPKPGSVTPISAKDQFEVMSKKKLSTDNGSRGDTSSHNIQEINSVASERFEERLRRKANQAKVRPVRSSTRDLARSMPPTLMSMQSRQNMLEEMRHQSVGNLGNSTNPSVRDMPLPRDTAKDPNTFKWVEDRIRRKIEREEALRSSKKNNAAKPLANSFSTSRTVSCPTIDPSASRSIDEFEKNVPVSKQENSSRDFNSQKVQKELNDFEERIRAKVAREGLPMGEASETTEKTGKERGTMGESKTNPKSRGKSRRDLLNEKLELKKSMISAESSELVAPMESLSLAKVSLDEKIRLKKKKLQTKKSSKDSLQSNAQVIDQGPPALIRSSTTGCSDISFVSFGSTSSSQFLTLEESWGNLSEALETAASNSLKEIGNDRVAIDPPSQSPRSDYSGQCMNFRSLYEQSKKSDPPAGKEAPNLDASFTLRELSSSATSQNKLPSSSSNIVHTWGDLEDVLKQTAAYSMSTLPHY